MRIMTRRSLLTAAGAATIAATSRTSLAQQYDRWKGTGVETDTPFVLPSLPYTMNALEKAIDAQTLELHHDKHHAAYVNNLNNAAKMAPQIAEHPMEHVLASLNDVPETVRTIVRNNLGGHVNHSMYWQIMSHENGKISSELKVAIDRDLGGLDKLQENFNAAGSGIFGAGWVFVTVNANGKLNIETRPNQDTPLMDGMCVLFGNDVWEHSYYLRYRNRRADYLNAWWNVVNWSRISERYERAMKGTLTI
ncbi:superoxide dismutase [Brucella anthropi]|uniref:superoxide dismutase n=1 Tax=Brucella anthropi TaxID=529 RepID=UPI00384B77D9